MAPAAIIADGAGREAYSAALSADVVVRLRTVAPQVWHL